MDITCIKLIVNTEASSSNLLTACIQDNLGDPANLGKT